MSRFHLLLVACLVLVKMCSGQSTSLKTVWEAIRENQESISDLEKESREKDVEISQLQYDLRKVKNDLKMMKATTEATPTIPARTTTTKHPDLWEGGVLYRGKHYGLLLGIADSIYASAAVTSCRARNMRLANIYSKAHYDAIMPYLRKSLAPKKLEFGIYWLGMIGKQSIQMPVLRDGSVAPYVKWHSGEPKSFSSQKHIGLKVHEDPNSLQQGMFTTGYFFEIPNVICEST